VGQDSFNLWVHEPVKLMAQHTAVHGLAEFPFHGYDELTYRVRLPERASWIEVAVQPDGPVLSPTFASHQLATPIFRGIPVATLDFTRQTRVGERVDTLVGERVSALTGKGTITFPDYPHLDSVEISESDAIGLEQLDGFMIKEISVTASTVGMHLVGEGKAKQIRTKTGQIPIQKHLTAFDALWHHARLAVFISILAAVFTTSLVAYRLRKEFKR
jgi:hypothetical protein